MTHAIATAKPMPGYIDPSIRPASKREQMLLAAIRRAGYSLIRAGGSLRLADPRGSLLVTAASLAVITTQDLAQPIPGSMKS